MRQNVVRRNIRLMTKLKSFFDQNFKMDLQLGIDNFASNSTSRTNTHRDHVRNDGE